MFELSTLNSLFFFMFTECFCTASLTLMPSVFTCESYSYKFGRNDLTALKALLPCQRMDLLESVEDHQADLSVM